MEKQEIINQTSLRLPTSPIRVTPPSQHYVTKAAICSPIESQFSMPPPPPKLSSSLPPNSNSPQFQQPRRTSTSPSAKSSSPFTPTTTSTTTATSNNRPTNPAISTLIQNSKRAASSLFLVLHSEACTSPNCQTLGCAQMKNILHHITSGQCSVGPGFDCPYKGCNSTKKLISHYRKCRIERTRATKDRPYNCLVCSFLKRDFSYNTELFNRRKPTQGLPPAQSQIPRIISSSSAKNVTPLSPNTQKKRNRSFSHSDVDLIKSADTSNNQNVDSEDADGVGEEEIGEEVDVEGDGWNGNYKLSTANINNSSFRRRSSSCGVFDDIGGMGIGKSIREEDEEDDLSSIGSKSSAASNRSRSVSFDVPP